MKQDQLFYIYHPVEEDRQEVVGPYSLEQMTGMLRDGLITDETPTCLDGEMAWQPLSAFSYLWETKEKSGQAKDKKPAETKEALSRGKEKSAEKKERPAEGGAPEKKPVDSKPVPDVTNKKEEKAARSPGREEKPAKAPVPKMDRESAIQLGVGGALLIAVAAIAYFLSATDSTAAMALMIVGGLAALVAQSLILAMVFDEGMTVFVMVMFLPFYDIYYFTSSLKKYMPYFYVKYFGLVVTLAAYFGLASIDPHVADHFRSLFGITPRH